MDRILISLKFAILGNSTKGLRILGWVAGALVVVGTWVGVILASGDDVRGSVLTLTFAGWVIGAMIGPVLISGNGALRPEYFSLLPIDRKSLSRGLLVSTFVGVASGFVLIAFLASAIHAVNLDPVTLPIALIGAPLTWILAITASRLVYGLLGAAMRSKVGVEIAAIQFGLMFAVIFTGWMVVQAAVQSVPALVLNGLPDGPITAVLDAFPSSWPVLAIESAAAGDWTGAVLLLGGLAVLDAVLILATIALLTPRSEPAKRQTGRRLSARLVAGGGILPRNQLGAVIGKEYRQWTRDRWRSLELRTAVWTGIAIGFFALVSGSYSSLAAFAGLIVAFMMCLSGLNLYGQDGTAVWQTIVGQDATSIRSDVRGRQWAMLIVFLPQTIGITIVALLITQDWWVVPIVVAAIPAVFGVANGVGILLSAVGVSPGVDPRMRVGPNDATGNIGLQVWISTVLTGLGVVPTIVVIILSVTMPSPWLTAATVVVGILNGWFVAWLFGRIAIAYLTRRMPDVYSRIRYGRVFHGESSGVLDWVEKTTLSSEQKMLADRQKERQDKIAAKSRG